MIKVENLTQIYKSGKGIFDLNFTIKESEVFGYLGPNGSGKTTTIRNLLGFSNATRGRATINGKDCRSEAASLQNYIGYLPGEIAFFDNMSGMQFLKFMGDMRKTKDNSIRDSLIERLDLDTEGKIKKMSKGMKQKLGIITAFMHDPAVYILDEPTSGLDPFMQNIFIKMIEEEKSRGKTIMMSSHIFEEVQRTCDRAGIIKEGRIVAVEEIKALNAMKKESYIITLKDSKDISKLSNHSFDVKTLSENRVEITIGDSYKEFFQVLSSCSVINLDVNQQTLEDIFMKYYGKDGISHE
ncbi:ABC transporter ATP-binding protein [Clostridium sp. D2Q-11]|uniref:ABC transporter ATP-binding protein n=1 Tax=Anaeromonas frigoriresistens TaxID=2683708 RepID=A0A942Z832_9FIRM|nr:ABC transporter ATP-binding protein [Anaeromonas frigoriresistens]MBS4539362.1 ABC transporter ATP-binding protein [Anaeromonas frigoriresistens]